jgi:hypothetical protein
MMPKSPLTFLRTSFKSPDSKVGTEHHIISFIMHHIITDGWSMGVLFQEVVTLYQAFSTGRSSHFPNYLFNTLIIPFGKENGLG